MARFSKIAKLCDVVVVDGSDLRGRDAAAEFSLNAHLATTLGLPVVAVVGVGGPYMSSPRRRKLPVPR